MKFLIGVLLLSVYPAFTRGNQADPVDSLKKLLSVSQQSQRFDLLTEIFRTYLSENIDSALYYANKSLDIALQNGDSLQIVRAHNARGWVRYKLSNYAQSIPEFELALAIAERNRFIDQVKYLLNNLAIANHEIADYDRSLAYHFQSLQLRESQGKPLDISTTLNNIGNVYSSLGDFENALKYYERSKDIKVANGLAYDLDRCYLNIALTNIYMKRYDESMKLLDSLFLMCKSEKCNSEVVMEAHYARSRCLIGLERLVDASRELKLTLDMAIAQGSVKYEAKISYSLAQIRLKQGHVNEALKLLDNSQSILSDVNVRDQVLDNYALYVDAYTRLGNFQMAAVYQQKFIDLNNEIFSSDLIKNISRIQTEHEERENIKTIAAKNQILALQQVIIQRQRDQYVFIVTITVLVVGLAFVLFWSNRTQRKANQALAEAKETIQQQNDQLADSNKFLESEVSDRTRELLDSNEALTHANAELDNFIYKTSHDIRGPLASLKGICNVALMDVHDPLATDYLKKLDATATKMNAILSRLLIINQINHSVLSVNDIHLKSLVNDIIDIEVKKGLPAGFKIEVNIPLELTLRSDMGMVKIILENLIDNAVKFRNESTRVQSYVRITAEVVSHWVYVRVKDNGIGIHASERGKIFNLFSRASEKSESGGVGLYLSKLATIKLGGDIKLHDTADGTTEFVVSFLEDLEPLLTKRAREQKRLDEEKAKQKGPENS